MLASYLAKQPGATTAPVIASRSSSPVAMM
jgi:hypothetical protein